LLSSSSQPPLIETFETTKYDTFTREQLLDHLSFADVKERFLLKKIRDLLAEMGYPEQEKIAIKDELVVLRHKFFGPSSEKRPHPESRERKQPILERLEPKVLLPSERYPELDVIETEVEFAETPSCKLCSSPMEKMNATEDAEFLSLAQKYYHIVRQRRGKWRCTTCHGDIRTAPLPPRLTPGGSVSDEIAIDVAVSKYADHLPIERYVVQAERLGVKGLPAPTLIDQTHALADHVTPVYEAIRKEIAESAVLHADETPWKMLEGDETPNWQMWGFFNEKGSYLSAHNTRAGEVAGEFLKTCQAEYLMSDAFSGYGKCTKGTTIQNVYCNAHARRKFIEAELSYPEATKIIEGYQDIYDIEREIRGKTPDEKRIERQARSKPIFDQIRTYLFEMQCLPQSSIGKAREYMLTYWKQLTRFLEDGRVPIDNNLAERGLRGPVLGRKNYYGNHSKRGAKTTSILYSLIESCKLNNVEPSRYLRDTVKAIHLDQPWSTPADYARVHQVAPFRSRRRPQLEPAV
jgi:transposase